MFSAKRKLEQCAVCIWTKFVVENTPSQHGVLSSFFTQVILNYLACQRLFL